MQGGDKSSFLFLFVYDSFSGFSQAPRWMEISRFFLSCWKEIKRHDWSEVEGGRSDRTLEGIGIDWRFSHGIFKRRAFVNGWSLIGGISMSIRGYATVCFICSTIMRLEYMSYKFFFHISFFPELGQIYFCQVHFIVFKCDMEIRHMGNW